MELEQALARFAVKMIRRNYHVLPLIPEYVDDDVVVWITPDKCWQIIMDKRATEPRYNLLRRSYRYPPIEYHLELAHAERERVEDHICVKLYPPGSEPSPEHHGDAICEPWELRPGKGVG